MVVDGDSLLAADQPIALEVRTIREVVEDIDQDGSHPEAVVGMNCDCRLLEGVAHGVISERPEKRMLDNLEAEGDIEEALLLPLFLPSVPCSSVGGWDDEV